MNRPDPPHPAQSHTDAPAGGAAQALVLHAHDNVATALRALDAGSQVRVHGAEAADTPARAKPRGIERAHGRQAGRISRSTVNTSWAAGV